MKINIYYTVHDCIEVPDDWDYGRIQQRCRENWVELMTALNEIGTLPGYDDMEWQPWQPWNVSYYRSPDMKEE